MEGPEFDTKRDRWNHIPIISDIPRIKRLVDTKYNGDIYKAIRENDSVYKHVFLEYELYSTSKIRPWQKRVGFFTFLEDRYPPRNTRTRSRKTTRK